jgi:hypothetical protein
MGYKGVDVSKELVGEAIRAYLADPNYIKTVAPQTAARIREHVDSYPTLSKIIQFNSIAGPAAGGAMSADLLADVLLRSAPPSEL